MNFKVECLKWNPALRCTKLRGTALYQIIVDSDSVYRECSQMKDSPSLAWRNCYYSHVVVSHG